MTRQQTKGWTRGIGRIAAVLAAAALVGAASGAAAASRGRATPLYPPLTEHIDTSDTGDYAAP